MKLEQTTSFAVWLIAFTLIISQFFKLNEYFKRNQAQLNLTTVNKNEFVPSKKNNNSFDYRSLQERQSKRHILVNKASQKAVKLCTTTYIKNQVKINMENQIRLMSEMKSMIPRSIVLDWKPYDIKTMQDLITRENCISKYIQRIVPYGEELEIYTERELLLKDKKFREWYSNQFAWDPSWPNCPLYGYPACTKIEPEKWNSMARDKDDITGAKRSGTFRDK